MQIDIEKSDYNEYNYKLSCDKIVIINVILN